MTRVSALSLIAPSRRALLGQATAALALCAGGRAFAQDQQAQPAQAPAPAEQAPAAAPAPAEPPPPPFSFDILTEQMRQKAMGGDETPAPLEGFLADLGYDRYRQINFRADRARWDVDGSLFRVQAFHLGWLFKEPVHVYEVAEGVAREFVFSTDDFDYRGDLAQSVPQHFNLPGVAGFRLHYALNRADVLDELVAFVGASYFRGLGRGTNYGLSARGLAINTGLPGGEEFPRFTAFYLERPVMNAKSVVVYAELESPSCTGAYRFEIFPGNDTRMEVTARLFFRAEVQQLGIAPLTSMFLFAAANRESFTDYRPRVHDSDGLRMVRPDGDVLWRALNNPPRLSTSVFGEQNLRSFGLYQRERNFDSYQDAEAHYETRPSLAVEPLGDWGKGSVRLVEIPSDLEVNDNIVAFWAVDGVIPAGQSREFRYRMHWGALPPQGDGDLAWVSDTRAGHAGVAGADAEPNTRKFVIDFEGGVLGELPPDAELSPVVNVGGGEVIHQSLSKIEGKKIWRLVADVRGRQGGVTELVAHIAGYDRKLTENWLYQWVQE
ncbi:glucan biosynthesis protein G [Frigidibacter sp. MR17.14]|uniref:glucan biosynthesis protein n=1 Tax=Frigidibacter sp. MR17.14 TaxID=3126509 RepID=UPI003012E6F3